MGGIWLQRGELVSTTSELVGYKSGLALSKEELLDHTPSELQSYLSGEDDDLLRIRSEVYEALFTSILHRLGHIPDDSNLPPVMAVRSRHKDDPEALAHLGNVIELLPLLTSARETASESGERFIDPSNFIQTAYEKYGRKAAGLAVSLCEAINAELYRSPWGIVRRVEWSDVTELAGLFESESLQTSYGHFVDQRFIDYLHQNFGRIDAIHWRKFEGLTCEYFAREGYRVEIGEGRNDGSIDARVWKPDAHPDTPPAILVQCKREKTKVGRVVVKALYADVLHEQATSGLIVTTRSLSPGAASDCVARGYPVSQANRETLAKWIEAMRTPYTGVFMGG